MSYNIYDDNTAIVPPMTILENNPPISLEAHLIKLEQKLDELPQVTGDAQTLQGHPASDFLLVGQGGSGSPDTAEQVLEKLKTVDTNESGLNANFLQGKAATEFALADDIPVLPTAAEMLTTIKGVDGVGSGLDADLFRGKAPSDFLPSTTQIPVLPTATEMLTAIKGVDGVGSGLDADLLQGKAPSDFLPSTTQIPVLPTAAEMLTAIKGVDGVGSGLDADLLQGLGADKFLKANPNYAVGAYGIHTITGIDLNTLTYTGFYFCSTPTNKPSTAGNGFLIYIALSASYAMQLYIDASTSASNIYRRMNVNGTWTNWGMMRIIDIGTAAPNNGNGYDGDIYVQYIP